jgi:hypothetical protein
VNGAVEVFDDVRGEEEEEGVADVAAVVEL